MFIGTTVLDLPAFFFGLLCACSKAACAFRTAPGGGPLNRFIAPNLRRSMADPYTYVGRALLYANFAREIDASVHFVQG